MVRKLASAAKIFIKYYIPAILALALITEAGLRLSYVLKPGSATAPTDVDASSPDHRILFVSDSILGTMTDVREPAGQFVLKMNQRHPGKTSITEIFRGGLLTVEVERQLEEKVQADRPDTVIFMIGKSDWVRGWTDRNFGRLAQTWMASLEVSKLAMIFLVDVQKQFTSLWPDRQAIAAHRALVVPWKLYSTQDINGIAAFESVMLDFPNDIRAIRALVHLYYIHSKISEGIQYLEKLATVSDEADFVRLQIANLQFDLDRRMNGKVSQQSISDWDNAIKSLPSHRLAFLARMRYLLNLRLASDFAFHLKNMSPEQSDVLLPSTYATLSRIIEKSIALGLRVIVLEYPSNHGLPLNRVLARYDKQIEIYESRQWLVDSIEEAQLIKAFKPDIEHLTPFGASHFADNLVRVIENTPQ